MSRLPVVGGDTGAWGPILNDYLSQGINADGTLKARRVFDLVGTYGVSTAATATANAAAIQTAFTDAALVGGTVYLRGSASMYPCNPLTLPRAPIEFLGDGPVQSVLLAVSGGPANPMLSADSNGLPTTGPFARAAGTAAQMYDGDLTVIRGLGFNGNDNFVSGVKGISILNQSGQRGNFLLSELMIYGCWGTGIELINSGNLWGELIENCCVYNASGVGFDLGSDMMVSNCIAANTGYEGFRCLGYGTSLQIDNCKAFGCGTLTAARGVGFYFGSNGAGISLTNCDAQDCRAEGMVVEDSGAGESHNVTVNGFIADSNSNSSLGTYAGIRLSDCHDVQIKGYTATDRFYNNQSCQTHALKVTNAAGGNYGNSVEFIQSPTDEGRGFPVLSTPVDITSDLKGTEVKVGASGGGQITLTPASGVIHPNPYKAQNQLVPMTANVTTVGTAYNIHPGCRLRFTFQSGGPGTLTVGGWDASYKGTASVPTTGGTVGQWMVVDWEAATASTGGTFWYLQNTPAWRP